jgi:excisionase family DNA binding protein
MAHHTDPQTPPAFLTAAELAARWKLTPMTLRRWRHDGKLKTHHLGRGIRFALAEIERIEKEAIA